MRRAMSGVPPFLGTLTSNMASRYWSTTSAAVWASAPTRAGQPPQHMASARGASDVSQALGSNLPSNSPESDTAPVERPRSHSVMVLMSTRAMRPAPLCVTESLAGVEEPVRMNSPRSPAASTARRAASQVEGTSCHSSTTWGRAPCRASEGSASTSVLTFGSSRCTTLSPNARAAQDLPHHLVPRISTAPKVESSLCRRSSTRRGRYVLGFSVPYATMGEPPCFKWSYFIFEGYCTRFSRRTTLRLRGKQSSVFEMRWVCVSPVGRKSERVFNGAAGGWAPTTRRPHRSVGNSRRPCAVNALARCFGAPFRRKSPRSRTTL